MTGYRPPEAIVRTQYGAAFLVAAVGVVGFVGRLSGHPELSGRFGSYNGMVPATALCLVILSVALMARLRFPRRPAVTSVAVVAVLGVAALEVIDLLTGVPVAPDRLFATAAELTGAVQIGRMSPPVAVLLALLGLSMLFSYSAIPSRRSVSTVLALIVANIGAVLCVGYAYDSPFLYAVPPSPPALPAAFGLMLLGLAAAGLTADRPPLSLFVGDSVRAQLLRSVLPVVIATTIAFAGVDVVDHRLGWSQNPLMTSAIFILSIVAVSFTVLRSATHVGRRIDTADAGRREAALQLESSNDKLERMVRDVAGAMGRVVEARDPYTQGHEQAVAAIARLIAEEMGMAPDDVEGVEMAALLHDIGKLHVPAEILTKPGRLSEPEFSLIKEHPEQGYEILRDIAFPWATADVVLQHHERADGSGYPHGLSGDEILPAARILAVADVIEAMASHRPYRPALGIEAAIQELRTHPERYDPAVLACCLRLYEEGRLAL